MTFSDQIRVWMTNHAIYLGRNDLALKHILPKHNIWPINFTFCSNPHVLGRSQIYWSLLSFFPCPHHRHPLCCVLYGSALKAWLGQVRTGETRHWRNNRHIQKSWHHMGWAWSDGVQVLCNFSPFTVYRQGREVTLVWWGPASGFKCPRG